MRQEVQDLAVSLTELGYIVVLNKDGTIFARNRNKKVIFTMDKAPSDAASVATSGQGAIEDVQQALLAADIEIDSVSYLFPKGDGLANG